MRCHFAVGRCQRTGLNDHFQIGLGGVAIGKAKVTHRTLHDGQPTVHAGFGVVMGKSAFGAVSLFQNGVERV